MKTTYKITFEITVDQLLPSVNSVISEINKAMEGFGFNDKITLRSPLPFIVTSDRPLTETEQVLLINTMTEEMNKTRPEWKAQFKSFELSYNS